eukprot:UC4_evm7s1289
MSPSGGGGDPKPKPRVWAPSNAGPSASGYSSFSTRIGFRTNFFLSDRDLDNISVWRYRVSDKSITTSLMTPFWNKVAKLVPKTVAPNIVTLVAFGCVLLAFSIVENHGEEFPRSCALVAAALTFTYSTLDAVDGKHARNCKMSTPLGELFDHGCDNVGTVFQAITLLRVMGPGWSTPASLWYLVQAAQLIFLSQHITPYNASDKTIYFGLLTGPNELLYIAISLMIYLSVYGQAHFWELFLGWLGEGTSDEDAIHRIETGLQNFFYLMAALLFAQLLATLIRHPVVDNRRSATVLMACLSVRCIPAVIMRYSAKMNIGDVSLHQIVLDGLFLSILTSDVIIAKVANRPVHGLLIVFAIFSIINNFGIYCSICIYYVSVFGDIARHMNFPLFGTVTNVFCDGIFDLLHKGHLEQMRQAHSLASTSGVRLFVGVCNDKDTTQYKRRPIMTEEERYAAVANCKYVHAVIRDSPIRHTLSGEGEQKTRTEQIIDDYGIHIFAVGKEYQKVKPGKPDFYEAPRKLGILRFTERTPDCCMHTEQCAEAVSPERICEINALRANRRPDGKLEGNFVGIRFWIRKDDTVDGDRTVGILEGVLVDKNDLGNPINEPEEFLLELGVENIFEITSIGVSFRV